jgi:hypothetical protein
LQLRNVVVPDERRASSHGDARLLIVVTEDTQFYARGVLRKERKDDPSCVECGTERIRYSGQW